MARRGTKPLTDAAKIIRGTFERQHSHPVTVKELRGEVRPPSWLSPLAKQVWSRKVEVYESRGQKVKGCEDALAQYCELEASLIEIWQAKEIPPVHWINAHRIYANEFYDTPASQQGNKAGPATPSNRFTRNGRPAPVS